MNYYTQYSVILIVAAIYFLVSILVPWSELAPLSTISPSYIFDILIIGTIFWALKVKNVFGQINIKSLVIRMVVVIFLSVLSLVISKNLELLSPFKYVDQLALQMLILAPFIEEAIYRGAFYSLHKRFEPREGYILGLSTVMFSLSHLPAIILPPEFHPFIFFQVLYTLPLGWICAKARQKSGGVTEPIILHFAFNLVFYFGVVYFGV